ncbi:MAG: phosphoenolpyruvate carboxylase, partial [Methylomonas sp.]
MSEQPYYDDKVLRAKLRPLKRILGEVLKTQANPEVAVLVEKLQRQFAALQHDYSQAKCRQLLTGLHDLSPDTLQEVIRAFSVYFSLLNIAEESSSLHYRRQQADRNLHFWPGSFHDTLLFFKQAGVGPLQLQSLLDVLHYLPVMTAHP